MTKSNDVLGHYTNLFKAWSVSQLGPKPTEAQLATVHGLGYRPGKQALASAMGLREAGVTAPQMVQATGGPQLNKMRGAIKSGWLKREAAPANDAGHTVYKLTLTTKGQAKVTKAAETAKADAANTGTPKVKAKGKRKAKVKVNKADTAPQPNTDAPAPAPQGDGAAPVEQQATA